MRNNRFVNFLLAGAGILSLGIGLIGTVVPLLPTTPFLLLSAACFFKSSRRLYNWLLRHRIFGMYIRSYTQYKAITKRLKVSSILILWLTLGISGLFFTDLLWVRIGLCCIGVGVTVHLLTFRTLTPELLASMKEKNTEKNPKNQNL